MTWPDSTVMSWVVAHRVPLADHAARAVMLAGTHRLVLAAAALASVAYVVVRRRYRLGSAVTLAAVTSVLVAEVLKDAVGRARPPASAALVTAGGLSMPSTDAALTSATAVAAYLSLTWLDRDRRRLVGAALVAVVVAVGACLVYLGVHWTTDVVAGWTLGATTGAGAAAVTAARPQRAGRPRRSGPPQSRKDPHGLLEQGQERRHPLGGDGTVDGSMVH